MQLRKRLSDSVLGDFYRTARYPFQCSICGSNFRRFLELDPALLKRRSEAGNPYDVRDCETLNAKNYSCPNCNASDRDRLYALFFKAKMRLNLQSERLKLVDIAPSAPLRKFLRQFESIEYRCADLFRENVDDRVDIQHMPIYADQSFDMFICSHVLEHVPDDRSALLELRRILKPGGCGILMVPINLAIEEIEEDPAVTDPKERLRRFGQEDHVRLYSKNGFLKRVKDAGFRVSELNKEFFGRSELRSNGISRTSVLYVVS